MIDPAGTTTYTPDDLDADGFSNVVEAGVGTDVCSPCGVDAWPPDINNSGVVDIIGDITVVASRFGAVGPAGAFPL